MVFFAAVFDAADSEPEALAAVSAAEGRRRKASNSLTEESDFGESTERRREDDSDADEL